MHGISALANWNAEYNAWLRRAELWQLKAAADARQYFSRKQIRLSADSIRKDLKLREPK